MPGHFSSDRLTHLFELDSTRPDRLRRRESSTLEFKRNFGLSSDSLAEYGKTMAAFSNRSGGYLVFGVRDRPHVPEGMTNDRFDKLDPDQLTQSLNNYFAPSIQWDHLVHDVYGNRFGLIYVSEAKVKPVVCTRTSSPLRDGDIFYRYQGQTRLITSGDLQVLIEERIERERRSWLDLLARTSRVEPSGSYILDITDGTAVGSERSFVISPELLDKVRFIHEGRFTEGGDPALRVLGDVEVVRTESLPGTREEVPVDPSKYCDLWEADVIDKLKSRIGDTIPFGEGVQRILNGFHIRQAVKAHRIRNPSKMYYRPAIPGSRPQYGVEFVDWIEDQHRQDTDFFYNAVQVCREEGL
ncbi:MAG: putative DNA binding domain-containing protein [Chloroflexi bacterium]|nr:putative DNA binding domain-containing protein [Chloroflexota bacterium]